MSEYIFNAIDWTQLIIAVIGIVFTVFATVITHICNKYIIPWIKDHHLAEIAEIAVNAAEAAIGSGYGEEKFKMALEFVESKGFNIDKESIIGAVHAAWEKLNINQITAGIKDAPEITLNEDDVPLE